MLVDPNTRNSDGAPAKAMVFGDNGWEVDKGYEGTLGSKIGFHGLNGDRVPTPSDKKPLAGRKVNPIDNLDDGTFSKYGLRRDKDGIEKDLEFVYSLFPILRERTHQIVSTLSGGQQQMVAIGRALMGKPSLLLLDEPSVGIAHRLKMEIFDAIKRIQRGGTAILMAEQDAQSALRIADRVYVLEHGHIGREGTSAELASDDYIRQAYLGVA